MEERERKGTGGNAPPRKFLDPPLFVRNVDICSAIVLIVLATMFRGQDAVKHYQVTVKGDEYDIGYRLFPSFKEFVEYFTSQPVIAGKSGKTNIFWSTALKFICISLINMR